MSESYNEQYIEFLNSIYFKLHSNNKIGEIVDNKILYDEFLNSINILYKNRSEISDNNIKNFIASLKFIDSKTNHLSNIKTYNIELLKNMKQIIEYQKEAIKSTDNSEISKEEFLKRYNKLISLLHQKEEKCNLVLQTDHDKIQFEVYRNNKNSLIIISGNKENPRTISRDRIVDIVYNNSNPNNITYEPIIIKKIINNTIFEDIIDISSTNNHTNEITSLKDNNLKLEGKYSQLEEKFLKREEDFENLTSLLTKSKTLEEDFNNAQEAVLKNLELKKATEYWNTQATTYNTKYKSYFKINIIIALALLICAFLYINNTGLFTSNIINIADSNITNDINSTKVKNTVKHLSQSASFFNYIIFILFTTIVIWFMKILVKLMLSNYHLSVDANERVIMINTYLVLLEDGKGFEAEDRKVILDNIFRQTNHGIIKDETSVTVADIVSSFKK